MRAELVCSALVVLAACESPARESRDVVNVSVIENPYSAIKWDSLSPSKVQLHDHVGVDTARIRAYDDAGYIALALVNYSGAPALPYAWRQRYWPADRWLGHSFLGSLRSLRVFVPGAEEVGDRHIVSPMLEQYIEKGPGVGLMAPFEYEDAQGCIDLVEANGGWAVVAHPWDAVDGIRPLKRYSAVEIYSAFAAWKERSGDPAFVSTDRNAVMERNWDLVLRDNPRIRGIAVNDHMGPGSRATNLTSDVRDSGKLLLLGLPRSPSDIGRMLRAGAFFAVRDLGTVKDVFPQISAIVVTGDMIRIDTDGSVQWIVDGRSNLEGAVLDLHDVPSESRFIRAEISLGSVTLYSQAFVIGPRLPQA